MEGTPVCNKQSQKSILGTLILLIIAFTLVFTAYSALEIFQSSLNFEDGIGTTSLSILYAMFFISALAAGPSMVYKFTPKWSLMLAWFCHTLFICANFHPTWVTLVPAAALLGFLSPAVWISQGVYFNTLSRRYAMVMHQRLRVVLGRFGAALDQVESISQLAGSIISTAVLHSQTYGNLDGSLQTANNSYTWYTESNNSFLRNNDSNYYWGNETEVRANHTTNRHERDQRDFSVCGPNHCPYIEEHVEILFKPVPLLLYIMMGIFLGCNLLGITVTCFLMNIKQEDESGCTKYLESLKLFLNKRLYLMMWLYMQQGVTRSFFASAFNQVR